ncbi:MAG TPA: SUMF1/EgtB/PvdO family nonheme iron enzyme, partial [Minicystis sp.]|nr:SUMF1/EgtB/PvdO family nonheme iron enzyme [Minicystis sp.]
MRGNRIGVLVAIAAGAAGCSGSLPPRPEIVLFIDTDAPVVGQLAGDATLSADAAIDTVRVEVFSNDGAISRDDLQTFLVPQASSWPVSFGIDVSKHGGSAVRVRVRGFRSDRSTAGLLDGKATLDPIPEATIDRLVDLPSPSGGVDHVRVTLHGACMGAPAGFDPPASCIDEHTLAGDPTAGVDDVDPRGLVTAAGSWTDAAARPCDTSPPADAPDPVCVQGGFTLLGDVDFQGVDTLIQVDSAPLIPAVVSPVYLDREEFTVGRLRQLVLAGSYTGDMPLSPGNPGDLGGMAAACTWVDDPHDASHDDLPLTCVFPAVADAICAAVGGFLPSEAAWEHAARGRGAGRLFPWGEDAPSCDRVCASRRETPEGAPECSGPL